MKKYTVKLEIELDIEAVSDLEAKELFMDQVNNMDLLDSVEVGEAIDDETNTCDKCEKRENTYDLVWITAEDFTPRKGEIVPEELYSKYDALCEPCYLSEITIKKA